MHAGRDVHLDGLVALHSSLGGCLRQLPDKIPTFASSGYTLVRTKCHNTTSVTQQDTCKENMCTHRRTHRRHAPCCPRVQGRHPRSASDGLGTEPRWHAPFSSVCIEPNPTHLSPISMCDKSVSCSVLVSQLPPPCCRRAPSSSKYSRSTTRAWRP